MTAVFSPEVSSRAAAVPPSFSAASRGDVAAAGPDHDHAPQCPRIVDKLLGRARGLAVEPLAIERRDDRGLRRAE